RDREEIRATLNELASIQDNDSTEFTPPADPELYVEMANGFAASGDHLKAAEYYEKYIEYDRNNWEVFALSGAAYQNSRAGNETNLLAARSYGMALALAP